MKVVLIDDEDSARTILRGMLKEFFPEIVIVGEASTATSAIDLIKQQKPDLVFMDVVLQVGTGFDVVEQFVNPEFQVIFISAHSEHAYRSYRNKAVDYVLKPIRINDLKDAIERAKKQILSSQNLGSSIVIRTISFDQMSNLTVIPDAAGFCVVRLNEIIRCEASRNYSVVYLESGRQIAAVKRIGDFEAALASFGFVRVHKSHLVNIYYIARFTKGRGGEIELLDGSKVPVSRDKKSELFERFLK